jgi:hypothetical protein
LQIYRKILEELYGQLQFIDGITKKQQERLFNAELTEDDWNIIKVLNKVLERFYVATTLLSGHKYPTLSLAYTVIFSLSHYLNTRSPNALDNTENIIKEILIQPFNKHMVRHGTEAELMRVAALLDPMTYDLLSPDDTKSAESFLIKEVTLDLNLF